MPQNISHPPVAIEYNVIKTSRPLRKNYAPEDLEKLKTEILLQAQGDAAEFAEDMAPLTAAFAFAVLFDTANEMVLRLNGGRLILILSRAYYPILRPEKVDETVCREILKYRKKNIPPNVAAPAQEIIIDLTAIWEKSKKNNDAIEDTKNFIKLFCARLKQGMSIVLKGEIPLLPFFSAIRLIRPFGRQIFFIDNKGAKINLFKYDYV